MSIYYKSLGNYGRLGNQMFQLAAAYAQSRRLNVPCIIPNINHRIFEAFKNTKSNLIQSERIHPRYEWNETKFSYNESINQIIDETNISGYLQSEKYFANIKSKIVEIFSFKQEIADAARQELNKINPDKLKTCFLHVRRGDYVWQENYHPFPGEEYYLSAINTIKEIDTQTKFIIISDDITWCKSSFKDGDFVFCELNNDLIEICLMTLCDYAIIANSSFSWWGAYLGPHQKNQTVIAPKKWFGPLSPQDWQDIYCDEWIII